MTLDDYDEFDAPSAPTADLIEVWRRARNYQRLIQATYDSLIPTGYYLKTYVTMHAGSYGAFMRAEAACGTELRKRQACRRYEKSLAKAIQEAKQYALDNQFTLTMIPGPPMWGLLKPFGAA